MSNRLPIANVQFLPHDAPHSVLNSASYPQPDRIMSSSYASWWKCLIGALMRLLAAPWVKLTIGQQYMAT